MGGSAGMGAFRVLLVVVTASLMVENGFCMANPLPNTFPLGKIGCLFASKVCASDEVCIDDRLFGNCQVTTGRTYDGYTYHPDRTTINVILAELQRLIDDKFTWHDGYTQCIVQHLLISSRERKIYDPRICEEGRRVSSQIDVLDEEISFLLDDLTNETPQQTDYYPGDPGGRDLKRDELLRIHKYNAPYAGDGGYRDDDIQSEEETYDILNKLSTEDLLLLQSYLKSILPKDTAEEEVADLSDIAPPMTPRYAKMLTGLINRKIDPEELNDDELRIISEIMGKMVSNIDRKEKMSNVKTGADLPKPREHFGITGSIDVPIQADASEADDVPEADDVSEADDVPKADDASMTDDVSIADDSYEPNPETVPIYDDDSPVPSDLDKSNLDINPDPDNEPISNDQLEKELASENIRDFDVMKEKKGGIETFPRTSGGKLMGDKQSDEARGYKSTVTPTDKNNLLNVDMNYAFIDMKDPVDDTEAAELIHFLERVVGIGRDTLHYEGTDKNIITIRVPPELQDGNGNDVTAQRIAKAAEDSKAKIMEEQNLEVISTGFGDRVSRVKLEDIYQRKRYFVLTFVLCGTVAVVLVSVVIIYLVRRHGRSKKKLAQLAGNDSVEASKDYQDLCRQRMQAKTSEKPEPINTAASRIGSVSESQVRSPSSRSSTSSWSEEPVVSNMDISTGHIVLSYMESHLKNKDRLEEEWRTLSSYEADPSNTNVARDQSNTRKNRFGDILPYDHSRVVLTNSANITQSDYINANTITDHDPRNPAYIATQAPLPHTVADFWQMVWEQGSTVIVMLARMNENGTTVCHRYWPDEGSDLYHIYEVHLVSEHIWCDDYLVRSFYLKNVETNETRTVTQFHFLTWADSKCAPAIKSLLDFRRKVNKSYRGRSCPVVVHCSDGTGRTGTYCLVDMVLNRLAKGAKEIDIAATLEHIRDQRVAMVKTKEQFEFVLACVAEEVHAILKALPQ